MTLTEEDLNSQQLRVLDLLKAHIQSQTDAIATLESKAQNNFTIINIIVAIVAALNLELGTADNFHQIISERPLLLLIFVGYALVVVPFVARTSDSQASNRAHDGFSETRERLVRM